MTVLSLPHRAQARVTAHRRSHVRPTASVATMTRYQVGTYSHTVDRIVFTDGTSARTDLIRLNPNLLAYSLDFTGIAPPHPSRYRLETWAALPHLASRRSSNTREAMVDWILRHSFPIRTTAQLSEQLRAAGYPLGPANISEHEAIAGTQAAIWHLTNGLSLDTRPLNVPIAVRRGPGPVITFEFDGDPQLGGYSVRTAAASVSMRLQKSANGVDWQDVSGSLLTVDASGRRQERKLGVGSTLSTSSHGRGGRGYRYYRLIVDSDLDTAKIQHVGFRLTGARHYRNAERVVHLYNYLLAGARNARHRATEPVLDASQATVDSGPESGWVGPFRSRIPLQLKSTDGHTLIDADGFVIEGIVQPGIDFYFRGAPDTTPTGLARTVTATLTATGVHDTGGRVVTGVAADGGPHRFTPVALALPTAVAIEFDIRWDADQAKLFGEAEISGEECI